MNMQAKQILLGKKIGLFLLPLLLGIYFYSFHFKEVKTSFAGPLLTPKLFELPIYFERNAGQTNENVKYLSRGLGYNFYFTPQEIVMLLSQKLTEKEISSFA